MQNGNLQRSFFVKAKTRRKSQIKLHVIVLPCLTVPIVFSSLLSCLVILCVLCSKTTFSPLLSVLLLRDGRVYYSFRGSIPIHPDDVLAHDVLGEGYAKYSSPNQYCSACTELSPPLPPAQNKASIRVNIQKEKMRK